MLAACTRASSVGRGTSGSVSRLRRPFCTPCARRPTYLACDTNRRAVLEAIRYEPEGTPIDEMFSELLSRSMDRDRIGEAHPSYPSIIRQLSPDEAKIIKMLRERTYPLIQVWKLDGPLSRLERTEVDELPRSDLFYPENVPFYMDHLNSLGLAGIWQVPPQEPLLAEGRQIGNRVLNEYRLTPFGSRFATACIPG